MRYLIGPYVLDIARRELHRGVEAVAVEPQVFDLLRFLIERADRVVTRDDVIEGVWGGRIVSESTLASRINAARRAIGDDGTAQAMIKTIARKGFRFVGEVRRDDDAATDRLPPPAAEAVSQTITFCRASDGVNLAVGTAGSGPVLLKSANWLNHIEYDWQSPIWAPFLHRLASRFQVVRYDGRGNGMSDRDVPDISQSGFVRDLDAVASSIAAPRFVLLAMSQGAAAAIDYAVRHPERVSRLILYGAYVQGRNRRGTADDRAAAEAFVTLLRQGWGNENSAFMRAFSSIYMPRGTPEQIGWLVELQRRSTTGVNAARIRQACDDIDVVDLLPRVPVPTLVIHPRHDNVAPLEQGRLIASRIPGAKLVTVESESHIPLVGDPAWDRLIGEIESFALRA